LKNLKTSASAGGNFVVRRRGICAHKAKPSSAARLNLHYQIKPIIVSVNGDWCKSYFI
jgi:hypothetical protein